MKSRALLFAAILPLLAPARALAQGTAPPAQPTPPAQPGAAPAAPTAPPPPSPEAVAEAQHQTNLARQAQKGKHYAHAAQLYEAAASLGRQPPANFAAGLMWELSERPERAADAYARALAVEGLGAGDAANAKERLDALEKSLGTLDVKAAAGTTVQLDGGLESLVPARLHGFAGIHVLAIAAPDRPIARRDVRLETGKVVALALKDEPAAAPTADPKKSDAATAPAAAAAAAAPTTRVVTVEAPAGPTARRAFGFAAMGLGVASLGASLVLGLETIDAKNAFNASPSRPLYDHEQTLQTWTNVALIAGAVLTVGGAVLVLWPSGSGSADAKVGFAPGLGGGSLVGKF